MSSSGPWYSDGLRFECTRCGACCTGRPGYVWVDDAEIGRLADHLGIPAHQVEQQFTRDVGGRRSLVQLPSLDCVFLDRDTKGCTVYEARPDQCRSWPFWPRILATPSTWALAGVECPGIGQGAFVDLASIEAQARMKRGETSSTTSSGPPS